MLSFQPPYVFGANPLQPLKTSEYEAIHGQDPYVFYDEEKNKYYLYQINSKGQFIVRESDSVKELLAADEQIFWQVSDIDKSGVTRRAFAPWAPEVHKLEGKYYMYYTAVVDDKVGEIENPTDNQNHRMYVAVADSPTGPFEEVGEIFDPSHHFWGIDMTIFKKTVKGKEKIFAIWSGWQGLSKDVHFKYHINEHGDQRQNIYIAEMESPTQIKAGTTRLLTEPTEEWEGPVNEGPQILVDPYGRTWLFYSVGESWKERYCQRAMLLVGDDPTDKNNWVGFDGFMFNRVNVGHVSFVPDADGRVFMFYHYKSDPDNDGWDDRKIKFDEIVFVEGFPVIKDTNRYIEKPSEEQESVYASI